MKLGIMQPYFFPYLGYFDLIRQTDRFVLFDIAQYIRHGWVNRNRILHPRAAWKYIIVPLQKHHRETPISEIKVVAGDQWKKEIIGQLDHYRKRAPYFRRVVEIVEEVLFQGELRLARLNGAGLKTVADYLGIPFELEYASDMNLALGAIEHPGDWALEISRCLGAQQYVNPEGGREIFVPEKFVAAGIQLRFSAIDLAPYATPGYTFEPGLSILDVMMWNSPGEIRALLAQESCEESGKIPHGLASAPA